MDEKHALIVCLDKLQQLADRPSLKLISGQLSRTFSEYADFEVEVIHSNTIARPNVLTNLVSELSAASGEEGSFLFYFIGPGQILERNGATSLFLALPSYTPGKSKGSILLDDIVGAIKTSGKNLIVLDGPSATVELLPTQPALSLIATSSRHISALSENATSEFSLCFERSVRRAHDNPGFSTVQDIVDEIEFDLVQLGFERGSIVAKPSTKNQVTFGENCENGVGLLEQFEFFVHNIYNYSDGSRLDGIDDLEFMYKNSTFDQKIVAQERLGHLADTDPNPKVRAYASAVLYPNQEIETTATTACIENLGNQVDQFPQLIEVPEGTFLMGIDDKTLYPAEQGQHEVFLAKFEISRDLITVAHFAKYVSESEARFPSNWVSDEWLISHATHPVSSVSWHEAIRYCDWLTNSMKAEGLLQLNSRVMLPSEAQWEKAGRGSDGRKYPWGDTMDPKKCNIKSSGILTTTPVGSFSPAGDSVFGCRDLIGNVREWTTSLWGPAGNAALFKYPYHTDDGRDDLNAPDNIRRVVRGGGYYYDDKCSNCVVRNRAFTKNTHDGCGFRAVVIDG